MFQECIECLEFKIIKLPKSFVLYSCRDASIWCKSDNSSVYSSVVLGKSVLRSWLVIWSFRSGLSLTIFYVMTLNVLLEWALTTHQRTKK